MRRENLVIERLIETIQVVSLSRLQNLANRTDIAISSLSRLPLVHAHWQSLILLSGQSLRLIFKAHFSTSTAQFFAANTYACLPSEISKSRALDFFKEYCNLSGGYLKLVLEKNGIDMGVSLPSLARGFDELFSSRPRDAVLSVWNLQCGDQSLCCSVSIEVFSDLPVVNHSDLDSDLGSDGLSSDAGKIVTGEVDFF